MIPVRLMGCLKTWMFSAKRHMEVFTASPQDEPVSCAFGRLSLSSEHPFLMILNNPQSLQ